MSRAFAGIGERREKPRTSRKAAAERPGCDRAIDDRTLARLIRKQFPDVACAPNEVFGIVTIDAEGCAKAVILAWGGPSHVAVYRETVYAAVAGAKAKQVAFFHNHPSGDTRSSPEDEYLTAALSISLRERGVRVRRHVILVKDSEGFCANAQWHFAGLGSRR